MIRKIAAGTALIAGMALATGCGEDRPKSTNRGDLRVEMPGEEGPVRAGSLDFGEVRVGSTQRMTLTLHNVGPDGVNIETTRFEETPSGVFFAQVPSSVPANGTAELVLRFSPLSEGEVTGRLVLEHTGNSNEASVALTGRGM